MTRATYRAWKCRQGVHRAALTHTCRDCRRHLGPSFWRSRQRIAPLAPDAIRAMIAATPSLYDRERQVSDEWGRKLVTSRAVMDAYRSLLT